MIHASVRHARIKISNAESDAVYHCITTVVNKERLLDDVAKEVLRCQIWQVADYCGVIVVTYAIMINHFHVLVRVPQKEPVSDSELLRRFGVLYPKPSVHQIARLEVIRRELRTNGPEAVQWRTRQLALMGDVSQFMKLLKQRFSIWFNKTHRRIGTLWTERFKSVLVEGSPRVLQTMAVYIDLNCVRAGLVSDPKDYRFCGYAEAVAGNKAAQDGIRSINAIGQWNTAQAQYREIVFGTGARAREGAATISSNDFERVLSAGGHLSLTAVMRCRIRYFTDGAVLGSRAFVETQLVRLRKKAEHLPRTRPRELARGIAWGDLATLRRLRQGALLGGSFAATHS